MESTLATRLLALEANLRASEAKAARLEAKVAELTDELSKAVGRIEELTACLGRVQTRKTSSNSSLPPSTDLSRKNQSLREKSGRPSGGQKGHKGHTLEMTDTPDEVIELPPKYCTSCGAYLEGLPSAVVARRQLVDIPPITPTTVEYRSMGVVCGCGHRACGSFPDGVSNPVQYGPNIQTAAIYMGHYQFLPFQRLQQWFKDMCGLQISQGTLENFVRRAAAKALPAYEAIHRQVSVAPCVGSDEASFKVGGDRHWFWVWQSAAVTYLVAAASRAKEVIGGCFPGGLPVSVLATDRLAAQLSTPSLAKQVCLGHLLRNLKYLVQAEAHDWATQFRALIKDIIALKQARASYVDEDPAALDIEARIDRLLSPASLEALSRDPVAFKETITFSNSMVKVQDMLATCLYHAEVPADNNGSERAFRMVKVKTKISGQFKSLQAEFAIIRSVIDTAIKNGQRPFKAIRAIVEMPRPG